MPGWNRFSLVPFALVGACVSLRAWHPPALRPAPTPAQSARTSAPLRVFTTAPLRAPPLAAFGTQAAFCAYFVAIFRGNLALQVGESLESIVPLGPDCASVRALVEQPDVRGFVDETRDLPTHHPQNLALARDARVGGAVRAADEPGVSAPGTFVVRGDDVVVLWDDRLFSLRDVGGGELRVRSEVNAGTPEVATGEHTALLLDGDTVLALGDGTNAGRSSVEVSRFDLSPEGVLRHRETAFFHPGMFENAEVSGYRVVDHRLVLCASGAMSPTPGVDDYPGAKLRPPSMRTPSTSWRTVVDFAQLLRPERNVGRAPRLHTVFVCDLAAPALSCTARSVVGPVDARFHVTRDAVYLWNTSDPTDVDLLAPRPSEYTSDPANTGSIVYRFPLGAGPITAALATGAPVGDGAMRASSAGLQALVVRRRESGVDWGSEVHPGAVALYTLAAEAFGAAVPWADARTMRVVADATEPGAFEGAFAGDHAIYGIAGAPSANPPVWTLQSLEISTGNSSALTLTHAPRRLETFDDGALVLGSDEAGSHATLVALGAPLRIVGHAFQPGAEGLPRAVGFAPEEGVFAVALQRPRDPSEPQAGRAEVAFFGVRERGLGEGGALVGLDPPEALVARCHVCSAWYDDTQPLWFHGRTFALIGPELVEGTWSGELLSERRRVRFAR